MSERNILKPDNQLGYLLAQVAFLKQRIVNAALRELDITYIQFIILAGTLELGSEHPEVTQQLIAVERRLDKAMVSNVTQSLIEKKMMIRKVHPSDKRAYTLSLTKLGMKNALRGKQIAREVDETFFSGIDKDRFAKALTTLLANENR